MCFQLKCPDFPSKMSGILEPSIPTFRSSGIATTQLNSTQSWVGLIFLCKNQNHNHKPQPKPYPTLSQLLHNQIRPNSVCHLISTSTRRFMHKTIMSFVQPQPNSIQNKNNPIGCGTAPGNLVLYKLSSRTINN